MIGFITEVVVFVVLIYLLYTKVWQGFLEPRMAAQQEAIRRQLEESKAAHDKLAKAEEDYRAALERTKAEAKELREDARAEGRQIVEELRERADQEYERITATNAARLEAERQSVIAALRREIGRVSGDLAAEIVKDALADPERGARVNQRFIDGLATDTSNVDPANTGSVR